MSTSVSASIRPSGFGWGNVGLSLGACALAVFVGRMVPRSPISAFLYVSGVGLLYLATDGRANQLLIAALLGLLLGSSSLDISASNTVLAAKFGVIGILASVAVFHSSRLPYPRVFLAGLATFLLIAFASATWSVNPTLTLLRASGFGLVIVATCVAVPAAWRNLRDAIRSLRLVATVGLVTCNSFLLLYILGFGSLLGGRLTAFLQNPNTLGFFMASIWPLLFVAKSRRRSRVLAAIVAAGAVAGLLLTGSRAGLLALAVGVGAQVLTRRHQPRALLLFLLSSCMAASFLAQASASLPPESAARIFSLGTGSGRLAAYPAAVEAIRQKPIAGWGFGTGEQVFSVFYPQGGFLGYGSHVSNGYLEDALQLGIPTAMLLLLFPLAGAVISYKLSRLPDPGGLVGACLFGAIVGGMVENLFESGMTVGGGLFALPFWLAVGTAHVLWARRDIWIFGRAGQESVRSQTEHPASPEEAHHK